MPNQIEQLDEQSEILADMENNSKHYWKIGYLGTVFQSYFDVKELIDESKKIRNKEIRFSWKKGKMHFWQSIETFHHGLISEQWWFLFNILGAYFLPNQSFIFYNIWTNYVFKEYTMIDS